MEVPSLINSDHCSKYSWCPASGGPEEEVVEEKEKEEEEEEENQHMYAAISQSFAYFHYFMDFPVL